MNLIDELLKKPVDKVETVVSRFAMVTGVNPLMILPDGEEVPVDAEGVDVLVSPLNVGDRIRYEIRRARLTIIAKEWSAPVATMPEVEKVVGDAVSDAIDGVQYVDRVAPDQPSQAILSLSMGAVGVRAQGTSTKGGVMPDDFAFYRVEMLENGSWVTIDQITHPEGVAVVYGLAAGTYSFRLVAVDTAGNASTPSEGRSIQVVPIETAAEVRADYEEAQARVDETIGTFQGTVEAATSKASEAAAAAVAAEARATEANNRAMTRLANGSFEQDFLYWRRDQMNSANGPLPVITTDAYGGGKAAHFIGLTSAEPETGLPVAKGQIWELSLYLKGTPGQTTGQFEMHFDGHRDKENGRYYISGSGKTVLPADATGDWMVQNHRITVPDNISMIWFRLISRAGGNWLVDGVSLRDVTDVVRLETAANAAREKAEAAELKAKAVELAQGGIRTDLDAARKVLADAGVEGATNLSTLDQRLTQAFTTAASNAKSEAISAAATDATTKANNARTAAEAKAAELATAEAKAAESAAKAAAALDASNKANAARDMAISKASSDATTKAAEAERLAKEAAAADAKAKADAAQAEAIRQAALDATAKANVAKEAADAAQGAAVKAQETANLAVESASGKSTIHRSLDPATGVGGRVGDLWWQYKDNTYAEVIGQWTWSGSAWVKNGLGAAVHSAVDIGVLTVIGQSKLADVVSQRIYTDAIVANQGTLRSLIVTDTTNLAPGGAFDSDNDFAKWEQISAITSFSIDKNMTANGNAGGSLKVAASSTVRQLRTRFPVKPGDRIRFDWSHRTAAGYNGTSGNGKLRVGNQGGGQVASYTWANTNDTWVTDAGREYTVPAGINELQITLVFDHTAGSLWLDNLEIRKMMGATMLTPNSVMSQHFVADESMTTKIFGAEAGVIKYLTATAKANFLAGLDAIGESWIDGVNIKDKQITARLMNFLSDVVGGNRLRIDSNGILLETSTGRPILRYDQTGLRGFNPSGGETFSFDPVTGKLTAVDADIKGRIQAGSTIEAVGTVSSGTTTDGFEAKLGTVNNRPGLHITKNGQPFGALVGEPFDEFSSVDLSAKSAGLEDPALSIYGSTNPNVYLSAGRSAANKLHPYLHISGDWINLYVPDAFERGRDATSSGVEVSEDRLQLTSNRFDMYDAKSGNLLGRIPPEGAWIYPELFNGWVRSPDIGGPIRFKRIGNSWLLDGTLKGQATAAVAFRLPEGMRPSATKLYKPVAWTAQTAAWRMEVRADGYVAFNGLATAPNWIALDGILVPFD